jgi:hypothetical protein
MFYSAHMRRQHPDLVHDARRIGLRNRMRDEWRLTEARADELIAAWEAEASARGLDRSATGYWSDGERWLRARAAAGTGPGR